MNSKKESSFAGLLLLATGTLLGIAGSMLWRELRLKQPEEVLTFVKKQFETQGTVTGSWIDYDPVEYDVYESRPLVYYGGISRQEDTGITTYQFICDAYTGDLIDIFEYNA